MLATPNRSQGLRLMLRPSIAFSICQTKRFVSDDMKQARLELLRKVYKPFTKLDKGSPEYTQLAKSGKVWEDYFRPGDSKLLGYEALQNEHKGLLADIDDFRALMKPRIGYLAKTLVAEYAHQSVAIEDNPLKIGDTIAIFDKLNQCVFKQVNFTSISAADLSDLDLPTMGTTQDTSIVTELKNHIVASQWIAETAATRPETSGVTEQEMQQLAALTIKGTESEAAYTMGWGGRVPLGGYRKTPISVRGDPLAIFPYHAEVPTCVGRFFEWRDKQHNDKIMHPLIIACQLVSYFVHVHPFPDGNGRVSRMLMHDYMVRQGYLPVVMQNLDRNEYLRMIKMACQGSPQELVRTVLTTQLDELQTFYWRQSIEDQDD